MNTKSEWVAQAKQLREAMFHAKVEFFTFLCAFDDSGMWREGQSFNSFGKFAEFERLCRAADYEEFRLARSVIPLDVVNTIGVDASCCAAQIKNKDFRQRYIADATAYAQEQGFPWSSQNAQNARNKYESPAGHVSERERNELLAQTKLQQAQAAVVSLRKRVKELEAENKRLDAENKKLKKAYEKLKSA